MRAQGPILLDALVLRAHPTGVGRSVLELIRALAAEDHSLDFAVLTTVPDQFDFLAGNDRWRVIPCPGARGGTLRKALYTQFMVPRICRRIGARLLHSLQFMGTLGAPCPTVVTVHDLTWLDHPETIEQPRLAYYRILAKRVLGSAERIVANSQTTAEGLRREYPQWAGKIEVTLFGTPSWVWPSRARVLAMESPESEAQKRTRPAFLFVSTLEPRKNLSALLQAYELFVQRSRSAGRPEDSIPELHLAGPKGWKDSELRKDIARVEATGRLRRLEYLFGDDLWRRYHLARALLFPSLHEGFGFPILEAMSAETPVLTSNRDSMAEVGGDCVLQVDPEDLNAMAAAMERLAWDDDLCRQLAEHGLERARAWNWGRTAAATRDTYRLVLDDK